MILQLKNLTKHLTINGTTNPSWLGWMFTLAGHTLFLVVIYSILYAVGLLEYAPSPQGLIRWDAGWFSSVRNFGYDKVITNGQSNIPFFPLFPYLWRLLGLDGLGISLVNGGLLLVGAAWLGRTFELRRHQVVLILSVPPVFFCLVPYAEALFFLFGAVLLRGLHRQHLGLTILGLLGCCLTRSAASLFVPVFVLAEMLSCLSRHDLPRVALRLGAGLAAMAVGLGAVMYMHYLATGNPWALFVAHQHWDHVPHWPLPTRVHSTAGIAVLWLDLLALFTGLMALVACAGLGIRWLIGWFRAREAPAAPSRAVVFALGYCVAAISFILLYQSGDLVGSSRYVLATPFFGVLLAQLPQWRTLSRTARWGVAGLASAVAFAIALWCGWPSRFPSFFPAEANWHFGCWAVYLVLYLLAAPKVSRYGRELRAGLYVLHVIYQAFLLNLFIGAVWLG